MANANSTPYGRIYLITNTANGKQYVGQTTMTLEKRWRIHCGARSRCRALSTAISQYGKAAFSIVEIGAAADQDELNNMEFHFVNLLGTTVPKGYNIKEGGGSKGKWSEAFLVRIRERMSDPAYRTMISSKSKAMWERSEIRAKISAAIKVGLSAPEVRAKRSAIAKEVCQDPEVRARMSASQKARFSDPDAKASLVEAIRARCKDPEYRAKMSAASILKQSDPAHRAKISASVKALWKDSEYRARITAAQKAGKEKKKLLSISAL